MDARDGNADDDTQALPRSDPDWSRRAAWAVALVSAALLVALVFGAYRQPELLLNIMGLRYCG